jgi:phenylpyruvate tautomerase PptA (4-oxalocrotonate tautomerase family)
MTSRDTKGPTLHRALPLRRHSRREENQKTYSGRYRVEIATPAGALTMAQKAELIRRVADALLHIEGVEPDAAQRARIYCLINEIPDGGWGFAGQAFTRERAEALRQELARSRS